MTPRILVSIATYNERDNLPTLIAAIHDALPAADVMIVDDNSPDGTGKLADELAAQYPWFRVLHRSGKLGIGSAILAGMKHAMAHDYDFFFSMDADFSHHPRYLPAMMAMAEKKDVVIGSRYIRGGGVENWPWKRWFISQSLNVLCRTWLSLPAKDNSGGFRCYRVALLRKLDLDRLWSKGYSFQEEMLYRCLRAGARVGEVPIIFANRREGQSKVNLHEAVRSLGTLMALGVWTKLEG
jgi:dolichol-phosphate mannosyltransferase